MSPIDIFARDHNSDNGSNNQMFMFPSSLSLSDNPALAMILADVPFLCIGVFGTGAVAFLLLTKRINRLAVYLFLSVVLAFVAAVLDLTQISDRGIDHTSAGQDLSSVMSLIIAQQICLALSIGARYLFFWAFVCQPPLGELALFPVEDNQKPNFIRLETSSSLHSGSWARWGVFGAVMKYTLLVMALGITVLQALWRVCYQFFGFGPVYDVDATLEIVVSSLFIMKLLANMFLSPLEPRWKTLRDYAPMVVALLINGGLGVGDILSFEFTESDVGRILQGTVLFICIVYVLYEGHIRNCHCASVGAARRVAQNTFGDLSVSGFAPVYQVPPQAFAKSSDLQENNRRVPPRSSRVSLWLKGRLARTSMEQIRTFGDTEQGSIQYDGSNVFQRGSVYGDKEPKGGFEKTFSTSPVNEKSEGRKQHATHGRVPSPIVIPALTQNGDEATPISVPYPSSQFMEAQGGSASYTAPYRMPPSVDTPHSATAYDSVWEPMPALTRSPVASVGSSMFNESALRSAGIATLSRKQQDLGDRLRSLHILASSSSSTHSSIQQPQAASPVMGVASEPRTATDSVNSGGSMSLSKFPMPPFQHFSALSEGDTVVIGGNHLESSFMDMRNSSGDLAPPRMPAAAAVGEERRKLSLPTSVCESDLSFPSSSPPRNGESSKLLVPGKPLHLRLASTGQLSVSSVNPSTPQKPSYSNDKAGPSSSKAATPPRNLGAGGRGSPSSQRSASPTQPKASTSSPSRSNRNSPPFRPLLLAAGLQPSAQSEPQHTPSNFNSNAGLSLPAHSQIRPARPRLLGVDTDIKSNARDPKSKAHSPSISEQERLELLNSAISGNIGTGRGSPMLSAVSPGSTATSGGKFF